MASVAIFLTFYLTLLSDLKYRIKMAAAPVLSAGALACAALIYNWNVEVILPIYSVGLLSFPVGSLGHRNEARRIARDTAKGGEEPALTRGFQLQLTTSVILALIVGVWLSMPHQ
ncbi:hypothetical protein [Streptomyces xanthochromogenes]|uniref:hypothetical protein n=1 Tax=Streptomyces xanthochromogenes TaxID=67384 RepID=UPI0034242DBE